MKFLKPAQTVRVRHENSENADEAIDNNASDVQCMVCKNKLVQAMDGAETSGECKLGNVRGWV